MLALSAGCGDARGRCVLEKISRDSIAGVIQHMPYRTAAGNLHNCIGRFQQAALMQNNLRGGQRMKRVDLLMNDEEDASSPSYFEWREQTVRMPAVTPVRRSSGSSIVRLFRRFAGKN